MARQSARSRISNEINAGSMADIAFLLLIFFLVTTTIAVDKGVQVKLPPWSDEPPDPEKLSDNSVFNVFVNANNQLLVEGEQMLTEDLKQSAKMFIEDRRLGTPGNPKNAIISLKNDRGTNYNTYLTVYNEIYAAYNELWDEQSQKLYGVSYDEDLPTAYKKEIKTVIPMVISEAEPTAFGEED